MTSSLVGLNYPVKYIIAVEIVIPEKIGPYPYGNHQISTLRVESDRGMIVGTPLPFPSKQRGEYIDWRYRMETGSRPRTEFPVGVRAIVAPGMIFRFSQFSSMRIWFGVEGPYEVGPWVMCE